MLPRVGTLAGGNHLAFRQAKLLGFGRAAALQPLGHLLLTMGKT
jgi:hypothetical protein